MHALEDSDARHQPRWQRRPARNISINRPKRRFQKRPVDRPRELRQGMIKIDDLIKPRLKISRWPSSLRSLGRIRRSAHPPQDDGITLLHKDEFLQENRRQTPGKWR
jgi:hypothetical protein